MDMQESHKAHLRFKAKLYDAIVKVMTFSNGYKMAKIIIEQQQYWALFDGIGWKLMSDRRITKQFKELILKHLEGQFRQKSNIDKSNGIINE